jgi:hypothetical protein
MWFLGAAVLLALMAIPYALRLDMNTELIQLLPADQPSVKSFREFEQKIGGYTFLSVLVESPDPAANRKFGEALTRRLAARSWAYQVDFRREIDFIQSRWPFLLSEKDLHALETDLSEGLNRAKVQHSPLSIDLEEKEEKPNWNQLRSFIENGANGRDSFKEFRTNADGTVLLIQVQMKQLTSRVAVMERILGEAESDIRALDPPSYHPRLRARLYGGLRFRVAEYKSILRDLARASGVTFPAMLLIPALVLRAWWGPLVVLVPVGIGMAWTYAGAQFAFGSLNLVTCFLFLILFGISDDYPIHLLFRIREEVQRGVGIREGTCRAIQSSAAPLALCALTNLAAFISLIWMQFRGFSQFGIIAGTGVMLVLLATALTVPGMVWILRKWVTKAKTEVRGINCGPLAAPGRVHRLGWHVAVAFVVIWGVLAGASAWIVHKRLGFEEDFEHLRPNFAELRELRSKAETIEGFQKSSPAVFFTSDFEASREIARVVQARMDQEGTNSPIGRVLSLGSILDGDSPSKRSCWERILKLLDDPVLRSAPPDIRNKVHELRSRLDLSPLTLESIPPSIRRSLTRKVEGKDGTSGDLFLVVVEPKKRVALAPEAMAFAARLEGIVVQNRRFVPAGEALIFADILQLVRSEGWVILLLASLATAALIYLAFRSWVDLTVLLVTLAGSLAMSLAILALLGMSLNFFNITVLPLLVGLGINYGIHILHRYRAEGTAATLAARNLAGAIGSAAATTVVGFAGLLLAGHPGLWSMGFTAAVGIGVIALSCLFFLPAFTDLVEQLSGQRKTAVSPES